MTNRPQFLDLRSQSHGPIGSGLASPRGPISPRLHVAGEIPPDLSPLDAFAAQSRLLAKQLEQSNSNGGRRMSRLPPLTIAKSLSQSRPGYYRSVSAEEAPPTPREPPSPGSALKTEVETPLGARPVSVYPTVSGGEPFTHASHPPLPTPRLPSLDEEEHRGRRPPPLNGPGDFGARRDQSPPPLEKDGRSPTSEMSPTRTSPSRSYVHPKLSMESMRQRGPPNRRVHDGALGISGYDSRALAPPRSPYTQRNVSPRSMSMESSDEDSFNSPHRKLSTGSGFSNSPISPSMSSMPRSPSISSEMSVGGTRLPRPAFNFSRPISRASTTGLLPLDLPPRETPSRQASSDSQPSFILADDTAHTPVSIHSEGFPDNNTETGAAPSYVYSKFSLPRGKLLQRNSLIFQEAQAPAQFSWEQATYPINGGPPPSPPSRPSTSPANHDMNQTRPSLDPGRPSFDPTRPSLDPGRPSLDPGRPSYDQARPSTGHGKSPTDRQVSPSLMSSNATLKPRSEHSLAPSSDWSAEEHVSKAIEYHEAGALTKSTYHLRLAARQNHPTGMLLYALACRHGWGMRPNQKEGVAWLRKAADSASLEVADDEDLLKDGKTVDIIERRTRKAQFALSIYELGVSHMNGWGIDQDKVLALRCFEIAGSWGDADALAEAGFCYAQGIGCKKDLKKSATFYRAAEAKGISMIGNSWIYKSKYNDPANESKSSSERPTRSPEKQDNKEKPRNKSRSRKMFGRK